MVHVILFCCAMIGDDEIAKPKSPTDRAVYESAVGQGRQGRGRPCTARSLVRSTRVLGRARQASRPGHHL